MEPVDGVLIIYNINLGLLFIIILSLRLEGPGPGAVLAGGLFAVSRLSWQWSMVAEVFALNNLFVGLLFFLTAGFHCAENAAQRQKVNHPPAVSHVSEICRYDHFSLKRLTWSDCTRGSALLWPGAL